MEENADERIINDNAPPVLGLGGGAPLLRPTRRRRVNGNVSQQAEDPPTTTTDETSEKLQLIRVKFLRLSQRLGQTPRNVVVAQFLYRLGLPELSRGISSHVGGFISIINRAISMAEQLEAAGGQDLDFSCTIMLLGKSGVGKSATVNSIFDDDQVKTDAFEMGTKRARLVEGFVEGIKVSVIDTPGLSPLWSDQYKNEKTLKSIRANFISKKKSPPDVVLLYLDRLDTQSIDGDMLLLDTITHVLGPSIWSNAIVGLTHASSAPPPDDHGADDDMLTRRCHAIQQDIRRAAGDVRLVNPVCLVENHPACRTNRAGQRVLPNGQAWKPHLLLLSFAFKILAQEKALLKLQLDNNNNSNNSRPLFVVAARSKAPPPLPFFLSYLLESDQLPPLKQFRRMTKAERSRLRPETIDQSNPSLIVGPVLTSRCWDHDIGYVGVTAQGTLDVKEKMHMSYSGHVDLEKGASVQLEMGSLVVHGEEGNKRSTSLGFEMQKYAWHELYCTLRSNTNFRKHNAAAGLAVTLLGDSVSAGVKAERKLVANKRLGMDVCGGGTMTCGGDAAYWASLESQLHGRFSSTLGLSVVDAGRGGLAIGGNIQTQVPIGRSSDIITARANLNRGAVQVSIRANIFEHLEHAMAALVPLFKKLLSYYYSP